MPVALRLHYAETNFPHRFIIKSATSVVLLRMSASAAFILILHQEIALTKNQPQPKTNTPCSTQPEKHANPKEEHGQQAKPQNNSAREKTQWPARNEKA